MSLIETIVPTSMSQSCCDQTADNLSSYAHANKLTLFENLIRIGELQERIGGKPERIFDEAKEHLDFVSLRLDITFLQAVLLANTLYCSNGRSASIRDLATLMKCKPIEVLAYLDDFRALERKCFLEFGSENKPFCGDNIAFEVPFETVTQLQKGECPKNIWAEPFTPHAFLEQILKLVESMELGRDSKCHIFKRFELLLENNLHLSIVNSMRFHKLSLQDSLLLLSFCANLVLLNQREMGLADLESVYQLRSDFFKARRALRFGRHSLQEKQLVEDAHLADFAQKECYSLTEKAKTELLVDYTEQMEKISIKGLTDAFSITKKPLFYPEKTAESVMELSALLHEENWRNVREKLRGKGMRTGFACLFSGSPGTGKTETAFQIASETGRDIMQVDISDTKSMWFGESEKRIKAIFNAYRQAVKYCETTPILLFNEADAVIGKRRELDDSRNGPGQTENTIQNVILQEIENLDGILIATTNLTKNIDKAFERRFLYKIEFEKPTSCIRKAIWHSMIPDLDDGYLDVLAEQFDFSGGQIENIARRREIASVLNQTLPDLDTLIAFCREEQTDGAGFKRIGFTV